MSLKSGIAKFFINAGARMAGVKSGPTVLWPNAGVLGSQVNTGGIGPNANMEELIKAYQGWVYAAATAIARDIAKQDLRLYVRDKGDNVEIEEHPFLDVLRWVNPIHTSVDLWLLTVVWLELTGNAYWYLPRNGFGVPGEIWPIPPNRMVVVPDNREVIGGYLYRYRGKELAFDRQDIVHLKYPNPADGIYYGMGTLQAAVYEYDQDLYMKQYSTNLFKNDGRPTGVITTEQVLQEDQIRKIQAAWKMLYGGVDKAGKVAVLSSGTKYERIQITPAEIEYIAAKKYTRDDILAIFGVPGSKLGLVEDVNRANAETNDYTYASNCILPRMTIIEAHLNKSWVPLYDSRLYCEFDNPVPEDKEFRLKERESNIKNNIITINEARSDQGYEPVSWGDVPYVNFNLVPITLIGDSFGAASYDQVSEENSATVPLELGPRRTSIHPASGGTLGDRLEPVGNIGSGLDHNYATKAARDILWNGFVKSHYPLQERFRNKLRGLFKQQKAEVLANLEKWVTNSASSRRTSIHPASGGTLGDRLEPGGCAGNGPDKINADPVLIDQILFDANKWEQIFQDTMQPEHLAIYREGVEIAIDQIAAGDYGFDYRNPRVTKFIRDKAFKFSFEVNDTSLKTLRQQIAKGLDNNETLAELTARVNKVFGDMDTWRALRVARTETTTCINAGISESYSQSGLVEKKGWLTARDEKVRGSHQIDGQEVDIDKPFTLGSGVQVMYPGDPSAPIGEIANDRCSVYPVLKK